MAVTIATIEDIRKLESLLQEISDKLSIETKPLEVYTTKELAGRLKVSTKTINNWRDRRLIEYHHVNGVILYSEAAITDFLKAHSIKRLNNR